MATLSELKLINEKILPQTASPHLLVYCPSMELLALGSTDQQVTVYRLSGQRVHSTAQKNNSRTVERIHWKPNGQILAAAWSDGVVRLVGAENNKNIHQIATGTQEVTEITCLAWVSNYIGRKKSRTGSIKESLWRKIFEDQLESRGNQSSLDLPRDISLIDIESSIPKLSILPAAGTSEDIFSSRASLDGLFRMFNPKDNDIVDIMIVATGDGRLHLSIYDSFIVGSFPPPLAAPGGNASDSQMILHASNENYSTHALLVVSSSYSPSRLFFVPMDLRFISSSSEYLPLLASRSTALQNLLRYIHQVQALMNAEWTAAQDLPNKFLRNINETLLEKNNCDIVQAMYHSVATGHTFPAVKEWLVDELAERGHKRWDKAVTGGLENLRKLVHENMLPALERCAVILSRLAGIVKFRGQNDAMGFSSRQIDLLMDTVACLNLVSARILSYVVDELDMFHAFSTWLRNEIDRLASDASFAAPDDALEKEATIDHSKVLLYIRTSMTTSRLSIFFQEETLEESKNDWASAEQGLPMFDVVDTELRKHEEGLPHMKSLPKVDLLCKHLARQATSVFQRIAEAEKRNVLFGQPTILGNMNKDDLVALKVCPLDRTHIKVYIALVSAGQHHIVRLFCIQLRINNGISTQESMVETAIIFKASQIKDATFLGDCSLVVLQMNREEKGSLLVVPCQVEDGLLSYHPSTSSETSVAVHDISEILPHCGNYSFPETHLFIPDKFSLSESTTGPHRTNATRLCMLDKTRLRYRIFTIPTSPVQQVKVEEDVSMS